MKHTLFSAFSLHCLFRKVNGLRIAFRTAKYKASVPDGNRLSLTGSSEKIQPNLSEYNPSPSPSTLRTSNPVTSPMDLTSYSPSHTFSKKHVVDDSIVRAKYVSGVSSVPHAPSPASTTPPPTAAASTANFPVSFDESPPPSVSGNSTSSSPPQVTMSTPYPPPVTTGFPSQHDRTNPLLTHQLNPAPPQGPQGQYPYSSGMTSTAFDQSHFQQPSNLSGYYPPSAPPPNTGYDTSIGFSFGGPTSGYPSGSGQSSLPAPYNPYHHQQQQQWPSHPAPTPSVPGYPAPTPGYPAPQGGNAFPQPGQQRKNTYGFNI